MASEKRRLVRNGSRKDDINFDYGSISYQRLPQADEDDIIRVRFLFRKKDAIIVTILAVLVAVAITTTLLIGIPNIRRKNNQMSNVTEFDSTFSLITGPDMQLKMPRLNSAAITYPEYLPVSAQGQYPESAAATNCPECSKVAAAILERNGSAMDAAIAATFCLSVVDIHHTGLGGGFLMTVYDRASQTARVIDARETAPALATQNMFLGNSSLSYKGALSVAVPSLVKGLWVAHQMYGKLSWSELIEPSISLAQDGFRVFVSLATALQDARQDILNDENLSLILADSITKDVLQHGDMVKQPLLAHTLRRLAKHGADEMYNGLLANNLVADIQSLGGIVTLEDLQNYTVNVLEPVSIDLDRGRLRLFSVPPPGSGALVAFFLNVMEGYNWTSTSLDACDDAILGYQRLTEALKFTYAMRTHLGDPSFVDVRQLMNNLLSKTYAASIRTLIKDDRTFDPEYYGASSSSLEDHGTSHVSVIGPNGDSVSVTSTINQIFGAGLMSASTGIILNDEMDDFSSANAPNAFELPPSSANYIAPGKRPLSSMCPSIIVNDDGDVVLVTGAAGGSRITSSTAYVILRHLFLDDDIRMATDEPRLHHQLVPNELEVEAGLPGVVIKGLRHIGHTIAVTKQSATAVNSVRKLENGWLEAVSDRRVDLAMAGS